MQFLNDVRQKVTQLASENATTLLTAGGVVGTVATAVLSGRAGYKLGVIKMKMQSTIFTTKYETKDLIPRHETTEWVEIEIPKKDLIIAAAPELIPPVLTGSATITAIIFSHRMSAQKAAALAAAYGLAERNLSDYKEKIAEKLTGPKRQQIEAEIAQDRVNNTPGQNNIIVVDGEVMCFDACTGRYFKSTMETIKQAQNSTNAEIINFGWVRASFFYEELSMPSTTWTEGVGWDRENMVELVFDTVLTDDGKPCISIDFKRLPRPDVDPKYL